MACAQRRRRTQEDGQGKSDLGLGSVGSWFCLSGSLTGRLSKLGRAKKIQTGPNYSADRPIYRALARRPKFGRDSFFSAENQNAGHPVACESPDAEATHRRSGLAFFVSSSSVLRMLAD